MIVGQDSWPRDRSVRTLRYERKNGVDPSLADLTYHIMIVEKVKGKVRWELSGRTSL